MKLLLQPTQHRYTCRLCTHLPAPSLASVYRVRAYAVHAVPDSEYKGEQPTCAVIEYRRVGQHLGSAADINITREGSESRGEPKHRKDGRKQACQHEGADVHHDGAPRGQERHLQGTHLRQQGK